MVIEVAVNGVTRKERNPAAPISPEEVAEDTIRCFDAGATVVHTHPHSFGDGSSPAVTAEKYASAYRTVVAERPEGIIYPTMSGGPTIADRWDHHRLLAAEGLIRCGCVDPGSTNLCELRRRRAADRHRLRVREQPERHPLHDERVRRRGPRPELRDLRAGVPAHGARLLPVGQAARGLAGEVLLQR